MRRRPRPPAPLRVIVAHFAPAASFGFAMRCNLALGCCSTSHSPGSRAMSVPHIEPDVAEQVDHYRRAMLRCVAERQIGKHLYLLLELRRSRRSWSDFVDQ